MWVHAECDKISSNLFKVYLLLLSLDIRVFLFLAFEAHKETFCFILINTFCFLKNLGGTDYFCPTCKVKFDFELSDSEKSQPKVK